MERTRVKEFVVGQPAFFEGEFNKQTKPKSGGGTFESVRLTDNTGTAFANVWSNLPIAPVIESIEDGEYVKAEVVCTGYSQYINVEIKNIEKIERPVELVVDIEALKQELRNVFKSYTDRNLYQLVNNVFNRPDVKEAFFTAPASQMSAYSFDGGLLAHVIRLIRLSETVCSVFNNWNHNMDGFVSKLNIDLLKTACMLHDVGKIHAYKKKGARVDKTSEGELFEDSYLSMKIILEELSKIEIPDEQRFVLEHVIGASKGKQNFGALFIPRSREAMAFHLIESLDVQMANFEFLDRTAGADQEFVQLFQKTMYLGSFDEE